MIKFFRKIRQKLLEQNRVSKYLIYAFGEIILVVIGILIALAINNWNENRKTKNTKKIILASIKQDLKADVTDLKQFLTVSDSLYQDLRKQSKKVNRISYNEDSLVQFIKKEINIFIVSFNGFNNNTYESMKASGKLDILPEEIKEPLFELSKLHNSNFKRYEVLRDDYYDEIEYLVRLYPMPISFSFIKNTPQNSFIWDNVDKREMMLSLNSWGSVKANFFRSIIGNFSLILKKTETILEIIEQQND